MPRKRRSAGGVGKEGAGPPEAEGRTETLERALGHRFARRDLLERALTHRSWAHEKGTPGHDSESLEFLGDAVLSLGVSRMLLETLTGREVGELARSRAFLVSEASLARLARDLGLGEHLCLGRGEERCGGRDKDSLLADAYEAVLAAVYLDGGVDAALALVTRQFASRVGALAAGRGAGRDHKTELQEALQAAGIPAPTYRVSGATGPDHRKEFSVELIVGERVTARGRGTSKKSAEQEAARHALRRLERIVARWSAGRAPGP